MSDNHSHTTDLGERLAAVERGGVPEAIRRIKGVAQDTTPTLAADDFAAIRRRLDDLRGRIEKPSVPRKRRYGENPSS